MTSGRGFSFASKNSRASAGENRFKNRVAWQHININSNVSTGILNEGGRTHSRKEASQEDEEQQHEMKKRHATTRLNDAVTHQLLVVAVVVAHVRRESLDVCGARNAGLPPAVEVHEHANDVLDSTQDRGLVWRCTPLLLHLLSRRQQVPLAILRRTLSTSRQDVRQHSTRCTVATATLCRECRHGAAAGISATLHDVAGTAT
jgi:hypothetical protein